MKKVIRLRENDIENLVKKIMNESRRARKIGSYRAKNGKTYTKYIDDENYISIKVGPEEWHWVTIEGDGEVKTSDEVQKEIDKTLGVKRNIKESAENYLELEFKNHLANLLKTNPIVDVDFLRDKWSKLSIEQKKKYLDMPQMKKSRNKSNLKEDNFPRGGMTFGPFRDIVDAVTDRYRIYREDYKKAFDEFNNNWPLDSTKVKTIEPPPFKTHSSTYPTNEGLFDWFKENPVEKDETYINYLRKALENCLNAKTKKGT